ncbi:hypothetical protein RO3G_11503 [Lichtheimia corymbifera JMRC:FSU:9682]|uniref:BHLH domain-containing protein n=1 Tax=Lichtheimia corymbifera JMRC:FSU:9682 TaxID=1263082 RepID=A0A068RH63_9FUNG|nr:hypothetical protein RO3G_11503 [Lichtheimia corymbifera JMRC:FSU:9682]
MNSLDLNSEYMNHLSPQYSEAAAAATKMELSAVDQPIMYQGSPPLYLSSSPVQAAPMFYHDGQVATTTAASAHHQPFGSPDSFMSGMSPQHSPLSHHPVEPPMLVASSSSSTTASSASSNSYLNQTLAKASSLPESFYPEFLQYSKESFEQQQCSGGSNAAPKNKKRRCLQQQQDENNDQQDDQEENQQQAEENDTDDANMTTAEMRRQIHIQSEQKRRAQIKDGFEDLRNELPACLNKKMSKVALLHRTVQHIQHLKSTQMTILAELERLVHENEQLRKFQQGVLQKQALENMYTMGNM